MLEVIEPGLLTTIQDAGRPWSAPLGVPRSGACDPLAYSVLQRLLAFDDEPDDTLAVLEVSLLGPTLAVRSACVIALAGADLEASVVDVSGQARPLGRGQTVSVDAGETIRFGEAQDGCRAYLGVAGGFAAPLFLGSRSTCLAGSFGGIDGRPLRSGDVLSAVVRAAAGSPVGRRWDGPLAGRVATDGETLVRVVDGPHLGLAPRSLLERLLAEPWAVSVRSDRMGIRLEGDAVEPFADGELVSLAMAWGAVQVPPNGQPIVLLVDHQTVGGYPVPLVVASVDRPILGQLRATDRIRFERISLDEARSLRLADPMDAAVG